MVSKNLTSKRRRNSITANRGRTSRHKAPKRPNPTISWKRFKVWSYRAQERVRLLNVFNQMRDWRGYRPYVLRSWAKFIRRVGHTRLFIARQQQLRSYRDQVRRHRRATRLAFSYNLKLLKLSAKSHQLTARLMRSSRSRALSSTPSRRLIPINDRVKLASQQLRASVTHRVIPALLRAAYAMRGLGYEVWRVLALNPYDLARALLIEAPSTELGFYHVTAAASEAQDELVMAREQLASTELSDWSDFWHRFRIFKWFFEYRRWRRCYQLSFWFRKLRGYRRLKKERFYQQLLRLYFYYLGEINENNIRQIWLRYRRLDTRYQLTGLRFYQMMQMRLSNLLVFMGIASNSIDAAEGSRAGIVRINGSTKTSPTSLAMAGDIIQLNLGAAFNYLTLFSDLYWVRVESQARFIGFMEVLFSMLLFFIIRWPRQYELGETDSRLNTRLIQQILRLLPTRTAKYSQLPRTKRKYSLHQNIVKIMPYKYRRSRRDSDPSLLLFE